MKTSTMAACARRAWAVWGQVGSAAHASSRGGGQVARQAWSGDRSGWACYAASQRSPAPLNTRACVALLSMTFRFRQIWSETVVVSALRAGAGQQGRRQGCSTVKPTLLARGAALVRAAAAPAPRPQAPEPARDLPRFCGVEEARILPHERSKQLLAQPHVEPRHGDLRGLGDTRRMVASLLRHSPAAGRRCTCPAMPQPPPLPPLLAAP